METCFEGDFARVAGEVGDLVGDFVPSAMVFFRACFGRGWDFVARGMCGVEVDHLEVIMECCETRFSRDARWEGCYRRKCRSWHSVGLRSCRGVAGVREGRGYRCWAMLEGCWWGELREEEDGKLGKLAIGSKVKS